MEKLFNISIPPQGAVFGHRYSCPCVFREGKWAVSRDVYGLDKFPDYVAGSGYVVTTNLLPGILETAQRMVYMPAIEDAFITGLIRSKLLIESDVIRWTGIFLQTTQVYVLRLFLLSVLSYGIRKIITNFHKND